ARMQRSARRDATLARVRAAAPSVSGPEPLEGGSFAKPRPSYHRRMPVSLDGQLVVAISSRALFDFEEENLVFEGNDDRAYMQLQLQRLDMPARPGVAYSLVRKLLQFRDP